MAFDCRSGVREGPVAITISSNVSTIQLLGTPPTHITMTRIQRLPIDPLHEDIHPSQSPCLSRTTLGQPTLSRMSLAPYTIDDRFVTIRSPTTTIRRVHPERIAFSRIEITRYRRGIRGEPSRSGMREHGLEHDVIHVRFVVLVVDPLFRLAQSRHSGRRRRKRINAVILVATVRHELGQLGFRKRCSHPGRVGVQVFLHGSQVRVCSGSRVERRPRANVIPR